MALDWLPTFPDSVPHHRVPRRGEEIAPFTAVTIAVPDVLATQRFLPSYPDQVPHRRSTAALAQANPTNFYAALYPVSWLPTYPDRAPRRRTVATQAQVVTPLGELVVTAQQLRWLPIYPDRVPHHRPPQLAARTDILEPYLIFVAAAQGCLDLVDTLFASTDLTPQTVTKTDLTGEVFARTDLINEGVC